MDSRLSSQKGFTLIELVIVIVIIGILAIAAIPVFADMDTVARIASTQGVWGEINSGITMANANCFVQTNDTVANWYVEGSPKNLRYDCTTGPKLNVFQMQSSPPLNSLVGLSLFNTTLGPLVGGCADLVANAAAGIGWRVDIVANTVFATTTDCAVADPTGW